MQTRYKIFAVRSFYAYIEFYALARDRRRVRALTLIAPLDRIRDLAFFLACILDKDLVNDIDIDLVHARSNDILNARNRNIDADIDRSLDRELLIGIDRVRSKDRVLDLDLDLDLDLALALARALDLDRPRAGLLATDIEHSLDMCDARLRLRLKELRGRLPSQQDRREVFHQWWLTNGQRWSSELSQVCQEHRNIGHDWQFTKEQVKLLNQYYAANLLLVECMNRSYVSKQVREEIEATMLLPKRK